MIDIKFTIKLRMRSLFGPCHDGSVTAEYIPVFLQVRLGSGDYSGLGGE